MRQTFYIIAKASQDKKLDLNGICSFVTSMKQAKEYIRNKTILNHFDHYKLWAEMRDLDVKDERTKDAYLVNVLPSIYNEDDLFIVEKIKYNKEALAAILRMFNASTPVGASYESSLEMTYFSELQKYLVDKDK